MLMGEQFMNKQCLASAFVDGFLIETWSGEEKGEICTIRGQPPVRHIVRVSNLNLHHPAKRTKCAGFIRADEPVIRFSSDEPGDTDRHWAASNSGPLAEATIIFKPCVMEAIDGAAGTETIDTEVALSQFRPRKNRAVALKIDVNTG